MNITLKILIVGDSGAGKTALIQRFVDNTFSDVGRADIRFDYKERTVCIDNLNIKLQIQRYSLQDTKQNPPSRGAHGFVIVFDLTDIISYNNAKIWLNEVERYGGPLFHRVILVGNKTDRCAYRMIDIEEARSFAQSLEIPYIETSSKTGDNVVNVFTMLAAEIYENSIKPKPVEEKPVLHVSCFQRMLQKFF